MGIIELNKDAKQIIKTGRQLAADLGFKECPECGWMGPERDLVPMTIWKWDVECICCPKCNAEVLDVTMPYTEADRKVDNEIERDLERQAFGE